MVAKLAEVIPQLELRCFSREDNAALAAEFGIERIPSFIVLNEEMQEIGRWVERPAAIAEALANGNEGEKRLARIAYNQGQFHADTVEEILDLLHDW